MGKIKFDLLDAKQHSPNTKQMFDPNPLSLSVPESEFESWLRDSGYLEIVDQRSTDLHRLSAAPKPSNSAAATSITSGLFSRAWALLSLLTVNPFSKLAADDFSGDTPPWTLAFFGSIDSYSFPSSPSQARLRVHENVKRFSRNYTTLFVLFFACSLYQLPMALFGLVSCLALWDAFKLSGDRFGLGRYPLLRQTLVRLAQCWLWQWSNCLGHFGDEQGASCVSYGLKMLTRIPCDSGCSDFVHLQCAVCHIVCSWCELCSHDTARFI